MHRIAGSSFTVYAFSVTSAQAQPQLRGAALA